MPVLTFTRCISLEVLSEYLKYLAGFNRSGNRNWNPICSYFWGRLCDSPLGVTTDVQKCQNFMWTLRIYMFLYVSHVTYLLLMTTIMAYFLLASHTHIAGEHNCSCNAPSCIGEEPYSNLVIAIWCLDGLSFSLFSGRSGKCSFSIFQKSTTALLWILVGLSI